MQRINFTHTNLPHQALLLAQSQRSCGRVSTRQRSEVRHPLVDYPISIIDGLFTKDTKYLMTNQPNALFLQFPA